MLAFLLLSDGPIDVDTLKPFRDEQWWARRDSLCRISSLGLWSSPRTAELSFLFAPSKCDNKNDESNHSGLYSALSMRRSEKLLGTEVQVPSEVALLSLWKKAFQTAKVGNNQITNNFLSKHAGALDVVAKFDPSVELIGERGIGCSVRLMDSNNPGKREKLQILQREATIEFLRKYGLNGSESLVLKKKNKAAIDLAATAWAIEKGGKSGGEDSQLLGGKCQLQMSFEVLYQRMLISASASATITRITLVLLHEDYPQELPVFGHAADGVDQEGHLIICVLGAVRDMTRDEEVAAVMALSELELTGEVMRKRVRAVGCNLGRTPEFTSKILASIGCHASHGRLGVAVDQLDGIDVDLPLSSDGQSVRSSEQPPEAKRRRTVHITALDKLAPVQGVSRTAQLHPQSQSKSQVLTAPAAVCKDARMAPKLHFVFPSPVPFSAVVKALPPDGSASISKHLASAREGVYPLVQAVVVALWRSRISGESVLGSREAPAPRVTLHIVEPSLGPGSVIQCLSLEQEDFVAGMAREHRAAPCESQVLRALHNRIAAAAAVEAPMNLWSSGELPPRKSDLLRVLPAGAVHEDSKVYALCGEADFQAFYSAAYADKCQCEEAQGRYKGEESASAREREREREVVVLAKATTDIIQVQHMAYHGRLIPALSALKKTKKREREDRRSGDRHQR